VNFIPLVCPHPSFDLAEQIGLGQSFLSKFKAWQICNATGQLLLAY
jgi:hypothetical protein